MIQLRLREGHDVLLNSLESLVGQALVQLIVEEGHVLYSGGIKLVLHGVHGRALHVFGKLSEFRKHLVSVEIFTLPELSVDFTSRLPLRRGFLLFCHYFDYVLFIISKLKRLKNGFVFVYTSRQTVQNRQERLVVQDHHCRDEQRWEDNYPL